MPFSQETKQALFDEAAQAIIKQGKVCRLHGCCLYDDRSGNHCAIGHLLKNRGVSLEGLDFGESTGVKSARSLFSDLAAGHRVKDHADSAHALLAGLKIVGADCEEDIDFLLELQRAHDQSWNIDKFAPSMRKMGESYGLDTRALA